MTRDALAEALAAQPYARMLGVTAEDDAVVRLPFRDDLVGNPLLPAVHGGVLAALMEIAAVATLSAERSGRRPRTVDVAIDYLRSAKPSDLFARAEIRKTGRRVAYVQVECWQKDPAQPVAALRGHFLLASDDVSTVTPP